MKLLCCLFVAVSLHTAVLGSKCQKSESKNCIVFELTPLLDGSSDEVSLPNLNGKTSLQIKGGNLASFGEKLSNQLGSVRKLQLGPLGLKELFLNADLLELTASDNEINVVKFKSSAGKYDLEKLDLRMNRLKTLVGFEVLTGLIELRLEDNQLETVDFGVFEQMVKLKDLHLERNQIVKVEAIKVINLPQLDYFSLAGNRLTKLNAGMWKFDSLTTWDVSFNDLIYVDGLDGLQQFQSLQTVMLSGNGWHCQWLRHSLEVFGDNSVKVGDKDDRTDCAKFGNICCDSVEMLDNSGDKLTTIEREQKKMKDDWKKKFDEMGREQTGKLERLTTLLNDLQAKSNTPPALPSEPLDMAKFSKLTEQIEQLKASIKNELDASKSRSTSNERSVKTLENTISQLRKSLQHEVRKIATLQQQFQLLRETTNQPKKIDSGAGSH